MRSLSSRQVSLIGLGAVGSRLATRLLEHGASLRVLDTDKSKVAPIAELGAQVASDPKDTIGNGVVLLSLPSPAAVDEVMSGEGGLLTGVEKDTIIADLSTLDPESSRGWARLVEERGGHYLDAPVTCAVTSGGGTAAAACGELTFLVGGDKSAFDSIVDVLAVLGRCFHHLGPAGSGSVMKLISNHLSGIQTLAIAEALSLAEACGFSPERTLEICTDTVAHSYVLDSIVKPRLDNPANTAHFAIELMGKDHRLVQTLAEQSGIELPMNDTVLALCDEMCESGYARRDNVASVEYFRKRNPKTTGLT